MNDLIAIKSGALGDREAMPKLNASELGYRKDEKALYIGTESENIRLCGEEDATAIKNLQTSVSDQSTRIETLEKKPEYYSKTDIDGIISGITARLDALENPSA